MIGLIPARGGSKGIPEKNTVVVAKKPLLAWTIQAAKASNLEAIYVSTDSDIIRHCATWCGAIPIERHPSTASDTASTASVMIDFKGRVAFHDLMVIQATSPLLTANDINGGIGQYYSQGYDSLVSVVRQHRFVWKEEDGYAYPVNHKLLDRPRRQDWDGMLVENGAFIITSKKALERSKSRLSGTVGLYEMPEETYLEIDSMDDLIMIERLLEARNGKTN